MAGHERKPTGDMRTDAVRHVINSFISQTHTEIGIAIRKGDPLRAATQKAVNALYANGTIKKVVAKWGMTHAVTLLK